MAKSSSSAETAVGPMVIAALEQFVPPSQRILDDRAAFSMLPAGAARIVSLCRWAPLRHLLVWLSELAAPGAWGGMLGRKRYLQDLLQHYVRETKGPVVVLGAGLDTKAALVAAPAGASSFEIDQAENITLKMQGLQRAFGALPAGLHLVPVDFENADLEVELTHAGFDMTQPAFFLWEGVTQYLSEIAIRRTMTFLSKAAPGSRLAFTFVLADFIAGQEMHGADAIFKRLVKGHGVWQFGLAPDDVPDLLATYGWDQQEQVGSEEYQRNYLNVSGRKMPVMTIERAVLARKL